MFSNLSKQRTVQIPKISWKSQNLKISSKMRYLKSCDFLQKLLQLKSMENSKIYGEERFWKSLPSSVLFEILKNIENLKLENFHEILGSVGNPWQKIKNGQIWDLYHYPPKRNSSLYGKCTEKGPALHEYYLKYYETGNKFLNGFFNINLRHLHGLLLLQHCFWKIMYFRNLTFDDIFKFWDFHNIVFTILWKFSQFTFRLLRKHVEALYLKI